VFLRTSPLLPLHKWRYPEARATWIGQQVALAKAMHADGTNFDFEDALQWGSLEAQLYTVLVRETTQAFHLHIPGSQVSVDLAWSPSGVDGRWYDYPGLAAAADIAFVMSYDMQSQIWGQCVAQANSPLELVRHGVQQYLALGIPASKLVLGLPWYGYDYTCLAEKGSPVDPSARFCALEPVSFRNCSCSDAAGRQRSLNELITADLPSASTPIRWHPQMQSPNFNTRDSEGRIHQIWFDNVESLIMKYKLANELGLRGVGPWSFDMVFPDLPLSTVKAMWDAFKIFSGRGGNYGSSNKFIE